MGDYRVRVTVEDEDYDVLLKAEYVTSDGYEIADVFERDISEAIDQHLQHKDWGEDGEHLR